MVLVIDASSIRAGGGLVHLIELLRTVDPSRYSFSRIVVCAPSTTLSQIEERPEIAKHSHAWLNGNYIQQWLWRRYLLPKVVRSLNAFLFVPGAIKPAFDWPYIAMCQNLLPLEYKELFRYGLSFITVRLLILRCLHLKAYKHAKGTIFLTAFSFAALDSRTKRVIKNLRIIPHGLNRRLFHPVALKSFSEDQSQYFDLLYISILDVYKHQDKVAAAVIKLNERGYKVRLTLVGPAYSPCKRKIDRLISKSPVNKELISYVGKVPYENLYKVYNNHHAFIFASTCETFGMIVTEAMAMGMPLLCTSRSSLKETVGDAAIYFDPINIESIVGAVVELMDNETLRSELSQKALERARLFSWEKCSNETFQFISTIAQKSGF